MAFCGLPGLEGASLARLSRLQIIGGHDVIRANQSYRRFEITVFQLVGYGMGSLSVIIYLLVGSAACGPVVFLFLSFSPSLYPPTDDVR